MYRLDAAFQVSIRRIAGSASASQSIIAALVSMPSRWPRCGRVTAVISWLPPVGEAGSTDTTVSAAISPLASCTAASE